MLQHVVTCAFEHPKRGGDMFYSVLQCVAVCCKVL